MSYVTVKELQKYSNVYGEEALQQNYIDSAENIINIYLGYSPTLHNYITLLDGKGTHELQLQAKPIQSINSIEINNEPISIHEIYFNLTSEFIYSNLLFPHGKKNIKIDYNAGWGIIVDDDIVNGDYLPKIIKMTVLRIATILQSESDSNIAVSSKSFADSGTRTFMNYTDYSKYLLPISIYKVLVI